MNDYENIYNCKKCECNKHADSCHYDVTVDGNADDHSVGGGGVCDDCKHQTTGQYRVLLTLVGLKFKNNDTAFFIQYSFPDLTRLNLNGITGLAQNSECFFSSCVAF